MSCLAEFMQEEYAYVSSQTPYVEPLALLRIAKLKAHY